MKKKLQDSITKRSATTAGDDSTSSAPRSTTSSMQPPVKSVSSLPTVGWQELFPEPLEPRPEIPTEIRAISPREALDTNLPTMYAPPAEEVEVETRPEILSPAEIEALSSGQQFFPLPADPLARFQNQTALAAPADPEPYLADLSDQEWPHRVMGAPPLDPALRPGSSMLDRFVYDMEQERYPMMPLPISPDEPWTDGQDDLFRLGRSDALANERRNRELGAGEDGFVEPTNQFERVARFPLWVAGGGGGDLSTGFMPEGSEVDPLDLVLTDPLLTLSTMSIDGNSRLATLRQDLVNHPDDPMDDPVYLYTMPDGVTQYTNEEQELYYQLADGTVLTMEDAYRITYDDVVTGLDPADPTIDGLDENGRGYRYDTVVINTPEGQPKARVNREDFPTGADEWKAHEAYFAFPDGTITMYPNGEVPEEWTNPEKRELDPTSVDPIEANHYGTAMDIRMRRVQRAVDEGTLDPDWARHEKGGIDLGPADPRAPFQNSRGQNIWNPDYWENVEGEGALNRLINGTRDQTLWQNPGEAAAWMWDMNAASMPYYHPVYGPASALARSYVALTGADPDTYQPTSWGGRDLENFGLGGYEYKPMSRFQKIMAVTAPPVEQLLERSGGRGVGGLPKFLDWKPLHGVRDWFQKGYGQRLLGSALQEGGEEIPMTFFEIGKQDGLEKYGLESYWNQEAGEKVYDPNSSRVKNILDQAAEGGAGGFLLGGGSEIVRNGPATAVHNILSRPMRGPGSSMPEPPAPEQLPIAPTREEEMIEREGGSE